MLPHRSLTGPGFILISVQSLDGSDRDTGLLAVSFIGGWDLKTADLKFIGSVFEKKITHAVRVTLRTRLP